MGNLKSFGIASKQASLWGCRIARQGWNGKNMYVFVRPGDTLSAQTVGVVKSLPESVKKDLLSSGQTEFKFLPYFCMKAADGSIVNGWLASQTDMLSDDWINLDEDLIPQTNTPPPSSNN